MRRGPAIRLAVTGSRHWTDEKLLRAVLDSIAERENVVLLIHGGAHGADMMAETWALRHDVRAEVFRPDYNAHGKRAPLVRNDEIVHAADGVIAFRAAGNSNGTDYTVTSAINAGKLWLLISDRRGTDPSMTEPTKKE